MSNNVRLSLFPLGAMIVAALGYFCAFFELSDYSDDRAC